MELLSQGIKDKLDILSKNIIEIIEKEEANIRDEVHQMLQESKKEHGALAQRLVNIDNLYQLLAELEQDLVDLRRQGNRTPSERKARFAESEAPSKERIEAVITELRNCRDHLSATYKTARPTHKGIEYLEYTTKVTRKFLETICNKYNSCFKDKADEKALQKLKYTIKLAETKTKELEENIQEDENPEPASNEKAKRKSF